MTREEVNALLDAYRDGTISGTDAEALARLFEGGTDEAHWARAHWALMGQLSQAIDGVDGDAMVASFEERLRAESTGSRIVRGVERLRAADALSRRPVSARHSLRRRRSALPGILAAAALVLVSLSIGVVVHYGGHSSLRLKTVTLSAYAQVAGLSGTALLVHAGTSAPATEGSQLEPGDRLEVHAPGAAAVRYVDGSTVNLDAGAILDVLAILPAKQLRLRAGALHAQVAHQADGAPLTIETAFARCEVIGTTFAIDAGAASTRLTVFAGRVRMAAGASAGGGSVEVAANQYALAAPGTALAVHDLAAPPEAPAAAPAARLLDGFEQESPWTHEPFSGPISFARSKEHAHDGAWSLRIDYQRDVSDRLPYGQIMRPLVLQPSDRTIRIWVLVDSHQEDARWMLQLHDRDNCYWQTAIRPLPGDPGWHEIRIAIPAAPQRAFAPPGHEGDPFVRDHVDALALNFFGGDAALFIDDIDLLAEP